MVLYVNACVREESRTKRLADNLLEKLGEPVEEVKLSEISFPVADEAFLFKRDSLIKSGAYDDPLFSLARQFAGAEKIVIVTQQYHLPRALYIASQLGLEAVGVPCDTRRYAGQLYRDIREILARDKDFFKCILKPLPRYLGEAIPIWGSGDVTNDRG